MTVIDVALRIIWIICGVVGFICISCFIGLIVLTIIDIRRTKEVEKRLNEFWGLKND